MVTVVQGKVCAKNHPDRLSRLDTIHQRYSASVALPMALYKYVYDYDYDYDYASGHRCA